MESSGAMRSKSPSANLTLLSVFSQQDARGSFRKLFSSVDLRSRGVSCEVHEIFVTRSFPAVVRGMHFQLPPHDHEKHVCCLDGKILDVIVDLREGSPTYGRFESVELDARQPRVLTVPRGFAHGFCVLEGPALVHYVVSSPHAPSHDAGIRWDSFGMDWPLTDPCVSERDRALPPLAEFQSPFRYLKDAPCRAS